MEEEEEEEEEITNAFIVRQSYLDSRSIGMRVG